MSADSATPVFKEVKHRGLITASVMAAMIMQVLDTTIANVALPHMQASLGAAQDTITWVLTSYIVAAAIATPVTGWLSDNIGRKRLFLIGLSIFTVASLAAGLAGSVEVLVISRAVQGLGAALVTPTTAEAAAKPSAGDLGDDVTGADGTRDDDAGVHTPEVQLPPDG